MSSHHARVSIAAVSAVLAFGCAAMALAHAGVGVPVLSRFGPGGDRVIPPAVVAFTLGAAALALVTYGVARGRAWGWALGVVVHALVVLGASLPYRGIGSLIAIVLGSAAAVLLVSPPGRRALLTT